MFTQELPSSFAKSGVFVSGSRRQIRVYIDITEWFMSSELFTRFVSDVLRG